MEFLHSGFQIGVGDVLNLAVDRQVNIGPIVRSSLLINVLDNPAHPVFDNAAAARRASEQFLVAQLHSFLAFILDAGKANQVGRDFTLGIKPLVFGPLINPWDIQCGNFGSEIQWNLALDIDECFVFRQTCAQLFLRHAQ